MAKSKFEISKESGHHFKLSKLQGNWKGSSKTWFEPNVLSDESEVSGTMKLILGGRFIMHEYTGSMQGEPFEGISIYGYDLNEDEFQAANINSFHHGTSIMLQSGKYENNKFSALGTYSYKVSPEEIQHWGWRTDLEIIDDNNILITIYNITQAGEEAKGVEIVYKRV